MIKHNISVNQMTFVMFDFFMINTNTIKENVY